MRFRSGWSKKILAVGTIVLAALPGVPAAPVSAAEAASLRLVPATRHLTVERFGRKVRLNPGVWVAATGGDFELRVSRPDYESPVGAAQVDADTGEVLRRLPADALRGWRGLARFIKVTLRDRAGDVVARKRKTFCPNGYDRQRVDDGGPELPRYPESCGSGFPFLKGMVWGIDDHWATNALSRRQLSFRLPTGEYTLVMRIARRFARVFGIGRRRARASVEVTVVDAATRTAGHTSHGADAAAPLRSEGAVPTVTDPDPSTLPDLAALPGWSIQTSHRRRRDLLSFASTSWNAGPSPLVVEGFRRAGEDVMDAFQYFYDADGAVVGRAPVGTFEYDARRGHEHWHFLQFAAFRLRDVSQQQVVRSKKQAFCVVPTHAIDLTVGGAEWTPWESPRRTMCGGPDALWIREELDVGWGDTYFQGIPGQAFDISDVPNGWYYLQVEVNPLGTLYQTTTSNDVESRLIHLGGSPGDRQVLVSPWHGMEA